ncbi:flagellar assembly protein A [Sulfurimonas sp.]|uniref:flagellar assembly protein A n=1 Tax=Sulfurimonas sp. TaxID=2022749 RepID=UPI00356968DA
MAFFGSSSSEKSKLKKIRTTVVKTSNVAKEIVSLAESNGVDANSLDFNILDMQTFTKKDDAKGEADWQEISNDELYELDDASELMNEKFHIKQVYEIEVFSKNEDDNNFKDFKTAIGANATKSKVYLSIRAGSKLKYFKGFEQELITHINNKKVRAGILINIFDEMIKGTVSKLSSKVKVEETLEYFKNDTVLVAESIEPIPTIDDEIVIRYEEENELSEHDKADYKKRGFIKNVFKDDVLIEYIKPKKGTPGRNCRGEFIEAPEPTVNNEPDFNIDDTIEKKDEKESIKYIAKENGYITFEDNTYSIKTDVDVESINFKTTGSIQAGIDSDVSMNVKETDVEKDAVGAGMEVEVTEIDIDGNVGPNSTVNAKKATIGGQTHKTSTVRADELDINVHKGNAYGKNIHISRLEHGTVDGDIVEVAQAVGGDIRGKEVHIEICGSYVKATSHKLIEIKKLQGKENVFTIDALLKKDTKQGKDKHDQEIKELEISVRDISKEIEKYKETIEKNAASFKELKKRLIHYKKNGIKMPNSFVEKYKQFVKIEKHLESIESEFKIKQDKLRLLTTQTASFQDSIMDARIVNHDRWTDYNKLVFKLVDPPIEIVYEPKEGSEDKIFGIVQDDDGEYKIQSFKEM